MPFLPNPNMLCINHIEFILRRNKSCQIYNCDDLTICVQTNQYHVQYDIYDITEILLKVALNTITPPMYIVADLIHCSFCCHKWY